MADVIADQAEEAFALAEILDRMTLVRIDPARWHLQRDELSKRLRRMAGRLRTAADPRAPTTTWRPPK